MPQGDRLGFVRSTDTWPWLLYNVLRGKSLFESVHAALLRTGIGLIRASTPESTAAQATRAADTSRRPARSRSSPPQCTSQPKLRSTA